MNCTRCEIAKAKLKAHWLYYIDNESFETIANVFNSDDSYKGCYWSDETAVMRSPSFELFLEGVGVPILKLNEGLMNRIGILTY